MSEGGYLVPEVAYVSIAGLKGRFFRYLYRIIPRHMPELHKRGWREVRLADQLRGMRNELPKEINRRNQR